MSASHTSGTPLPAAPSTCARRSATQRPARPGRGMLALVAVGTLAGWLLGGQPAAADNFIQLYLAAQGGCANAAASPLAFVLSGSNQQAPFGKAAEDWSDNDLAVLKAMLAVCQAASAQAGNPYTLQEVRQQSDELLARVPELVAQARARVQAQAQQVEARRQLAAARFNSAVQAKQQARASAEAEASRLEREATAAEAEARDAQQRLAERIQRATRSRDEAKAKATAVAGIERWAAQDAGALSPDDTRCSTTIRDFDGEDKRKIFAIDRYVEEVMREEDRKHVKNGERSMIAELSREGFMKIRAMAIVYCRQGPSSSLRAAAAEAYDGARSLQHELEGR